MTQVIKPKTRGLAILPAVFTLLYVLVLAYLHAFALRLVPVEGQLDAAWKTQRPAGSLRHGSATYVDVRLRYEYKGVAYETGRLNVANGGMLIGALADWKVSSLGALPRRTTVWVDPDDPGYAVLERGVGLSRDPSRDNFGGVVSDPKRTEARDACSTSTIACALFYGGAMRSPLPSNSRIDR